MELARFITDEQVGGSSPLALSKILRLRSSMELERRSSKPEVVRSSRTEAFLLVVNGKWKVVNAKFFLLLTTFYLPFTTIFRGRLTAGRRILAPEIKVQILSPKPISVFIFYLRVA